MNSWTVVVHTGSMKVKRILDLRTSQEKAVDPVSGCIRPWLCPYSLGLCCTIGESRSISDRTIRIDKYVQLEHTILE